MTPTILCYLLLVLYYQLGMNSKKFTESEVLPSNFKTTMIESNEDRGDSENDI